MGRLRTTERASPQPCQYQSTTHASTARPRHVPPSASTLRNPEPALSTPSPFPTRALLTPGTPEPPRRLPCRPLTLGTTPLSPPEPWRSTSTDCKAVPRASHTKHVHMADCCATRRRERAPSAICTPKASGLRDARLSDTEGGSGIASCNVCIVTARGAAAKVERSDVLRPREGKYPSDMKSHTRGRAGEIHGWRGHGLRVEHRGCHAFCLFGIGVRRYTYRGNGYVADAVVERRVRYAVAVYKVPGSHKNVRQSVNWPARAGAKGKE